MVQSINSIAELKSGMLELFGVEEGDLRTYSPLTLAYLGDCVYELVIRTILCEREKCSPGKLHPKTSRLVKASAQSQIITALEPDLTEEESSIYRRGRNAHSPSTPKHASIGDYRRATGFEALIGWLYLKGDYARILELIRKGIGEELL